MAQMEPMWKDTSFRFRRITLTAETQDQSPLSLKPAFYSVTNFVYEIHTLGQAGQRKEYENVNEFKLNIVLSF